MSLHSLMFGWEYPPLHLGGLGVACQGLVQGLLKNGVKVTLVLPHPIGSIAEHITVRSGGDCEITSVPAEIQPYDTVESYAVRMMGIPREKTEIYGKDLGQAIERFAASSVDLTEDIRPDVVHCHDWMTYGAGIRAARHHHVPPVAHIHATELDRTNFQPDRWIFRCEQEGFLAADRIIAVSNYTKDILVGHYGINPQKIAVVHNGTGNALSRRATFVANVGRKKRAPLVLFLGRLVLQKGPMQFLAMAAIVHRKKPEVQFCIAGDGHMLPELFERTKALGLEKCITFTGRIRGSEVHALYRKADCFVMPSLSEPFGLVALEAAMNGTPVVISKQSGVAEVLDHALKVDFWDVEKMADCVLTILRDETLARQLTSEAGSAAKKLTWRHQASAVRSIYEQLLHT